MANILDKIIEDKKESLKLIKKTKAKTLGVIILLELAFLNGRSKMKDKLVSLYSVST